MSDQKIGERLLRIRQAQKLSQIEFAERLGVSAGAYKNYERGEREIPSLLLLALFKEFGIDPLWVLGDEENESEQPIVRPKHDHSLLIAIGTAVEDAIAKQGIKLTSAKKWEIVGYAYRQALIQAKPDASLPKADDASISALVSIVGK